MAEFILTLSLQGYRITFQCNVANPNWVAVMMSKDGINVRGNVIKDKWNDDHACGALAQIKSTLDQRIAAK